MIQSLTYKVLNACNKEKVQKLVPVILPASWDSKTATDDYISKLTNKLIKFRF